MRRRRLKTAALSRLSWSSTGRRSWTALFSQLRRMRRVAVSRSILDRGGSSLPLPVKALHAIHLATALQFREREEPDLLFATHDRQQGKAALALGFQVIGL